LAANATKLATGSLEEVFLAHDPLLKTNRYRKSEVIESPNEPATSVHIVLSGVVAKFSVNDCRAERLLELLGPGELLGEPAILSASSPLRRTIALGNVRVLSWDTAAVERMIEEQPGAGMALLRSVIRRNADYAARIDGFSRETVESRLAGAILRLAARLGEPEADGWVRLMPLTQATLADYIGTSRELVTIHMNRFRQSGLLTYSRRMIRVDPGRLSRRVAELGMPAGSKTGED
jgi:CRP-like cAMP-binding protein